MCASLRTPDDRTCELCGRKEQWDEAVGAWRIVVEDGERIVGDGYCIHEWDITGEFSPIEE